MLYTVVLAGLVMTTRSGAAAVSERTGSDSFTVSSAAGSGGGVDETVVLSVAGDDADDAAPADSSVG
jgi:hypothetical protein